MGNSSNCCNEQQLQHEDINLALTQSFHLVKNQHQTGSIKLNQQIADKIDSPQPNMQSTQQIKHEMKQKNSKRSSPSQPQIENAPQSNSSGSSDEEDEEVDCKPEFQHKFTLGNLPDRFSSATEMKQLNSLVLSKGEKSKNSCYPRVENFLNSKNSIFTKAQKAVQDPKPLRNQVTNANNINEIESNIRGSRCATSKDFTLLSKLQSISGAGMLYNPSQSEAQLGQPNNNNNQQTLPYQLQESLKKNIERNKGRQLSQFQNGENNQQNQENQENRIINITNDDDQYDYNQNKQPQNKVEYPQQRVFVEKASKQSEDVRSGFTWNSNQLNLNPKNALESVSAVTVQQNQHYKIKQYLNIQTLADLNDFEKLIGNRYLVCNIEFKEYNDQYVKPFSTFISMLHTNETKLKITFSQSSLNTLKLSITQISQLQNLTKFQISLFNLLLDDAVLASFAQSLKVLQNLEDLSLNFGMNNFTSQGFNQVLQELKSGNCLQRLTFIASYNQFNDANLQALARVVKNYEHLQKVNFRFSNCPITAEGLNPIMGALGDLKLLRSLLLDVSKTQQIDLDVERFNRLINVKTLKTCNMNIGWCQLDQDKMGELVEVIKQRADYDYNEELNFWFQLQSNVKQKQMEDIVSKASNKNWQVQSNQNPSLDRIIKYY